MNTNKKGDIGLANIILDTLSKRFFVFLPFSDTTHVDLIIADEKMKMYRVQVKYMKIDKFGALNICTSTVVNGKKVPMDLSQIDVWAIYCSDNNQIYYIPTKKLIGKKYLSLRIKKPKQIQKTIHYAHDYLNIEDALI